MAFRKLTPEEERVIIEFYLIENRQSVDNGFNLGYQVWHRLSSHGPIFGELLIEKDITAIGAIEGTPA